MGKILGFKKFNSKEKGTRCCILFQQTEFSEAEKTKGCAGVSVEQIMVFNSTADSVTPDIVGKEVEFQCSFSGGRPRIEGFTICK